MPLKVIDVAGGTGDISFRILNKAKADSPHSKFSQQTNHNDLYTIAFGIRNVTNRQKALSEAYRVLRKGGRFMCLEFSEVEVPIFKQFYDFYSFNVIPQLGHFIANDKDSYQYLVESIRKFPK